MLEAIELCQQIAGRELEHARRAAPHRRPSLVDQRPAAVHDRLPRVAGHPRAGGRSCGSCTRATPSAGSRRLIELGPRWLRRARGPTSSARAPQPARSSSCRLLDGHLRSSPVPRHLTVASRFVHVRTDSAVCRASGALDRPRPPPSRRPPPRAAAPLTSRRLTAQVHLPGPDRSASAGLPCAPSSEAQLARIDVQVAGEQQRAASRANAPIATRCAHARSASRAPAPRAEQGLEPLRRRIQVRAPHIDRPGIRHSAPAEGARLAN